MGCTILGHVDRAEYDARIAELERLLLLAVNSCENQACWDKRPWAEWYYEAKRLVKPSEFDRAALAAVGEKK